ncbi:uncharacterized protein LOC109835518 [Asparagus officinalis]|uniref:uncharacterized protein LOC109835518 n=1 Tax=Asparagus officinalis TaxID=4686 RepID=UPI00098E11F0|nr:uncharacterized protein LOC109835518 [Asparagus officinalis]
MKKKMKNEIISPPTCGESSKRSREPTVGLIDDYTASDQELTKRLKGKMKQNGVKDYFLKEKRKDVIGNKSLHPLQIGATFYKSIETFKEAHTEQYIFELVNGAIEQIGADKVIHVVIDNATANMVAKELLYRARLRIFWTSHRLLEKKGEMRYMFFDEAWVRCKLAKVAIGQRVIDSDYKSSMGFLVGMLEDMKKDIIQVFKKMEKDFMPVIDIINGKSKDLPISPLHTASY